MGITVQSSCIQPCMQLYINHCAAMYTSVYYCTPTTVLLCTLLYTTVHQPLCCNIHFCILLYINLCAAMCTFVHFCILLQVPLNILYILSHTVTQKEVMDLERTYWGLKGSGKFDLNTFEMYASPPVPKELCEGTKMFLVWSFPVFGCSQNSCVVASI